MGYISPPGVPRASWRRGHPAEGRERGCKAVLGGGADWQVPPPHSSQPPGQRQGSWYRWNRGGLSGEASVCRGGEGGHRGQRQRTGWGESRGSGVCSPPVPGAECAGCGAAGGAVVREMRALLARRPGRGSPTTAPEPGGAEGGLRARARRAARGFDGGKKCTPSCVFPESPYFFLFFSEALLSGARKLLSRPGEEAPGGRGGIKRSAEAGIFGGPEKAISLESHLCCGVCPGPVSRHVPHPSFVCGFPGKRARSGAAGGAAGGPPHPEQAPLGARTCVCTCEPACAHVCACVRPPLAPEFLGVPCERSSGLGGSPVSP